MADRYWVGGTGTWNSTNTANWSATSGGAGGASVPTSVDNVFFNSASSAAAYTVTWTSGQVNCQDISISGPATGTVTHSGTASWNCYGNFYVAPTGVAALPAGSLTLQGATVTSFTTNGFALPFSVTQWKTTGITSGVVLGGAITFSGTINGWTVLGGKFDTNGMTITAAGITSTNSAMNRGITLNSSTLYVGSFSISMTGLTLDTGTATISSTTAFIQHSVSVDTSASFYNWAPVINTYGHGTYGNLTFSNVTLPPVTDFTTPQVWWFGGNVTVTGTLTMTTSYRRTFMSTSGTQRTLTVAAKVGLAEVDFYNIGVAGASAPWSGTNLGDAGGNTGISAFATPRALSPSTNGTSWYQLWGNSAATYANIPRPQDTVTFNNSFIATSANVGVWSGVYLLPSIDASGRTLAMTLSGQYMVGANYNFGTAVVVSGGQFFRVTGTQNVTGGAAATTFAGMYIGQYSQSGYTFQLTGNATFPTSNYINHYYGTIALGSYTMQAGYYQLMNTTIAGGSAITCSTGQMALAYTSGTVWTANSTYLTLGATFKVNLNGAAIATNTRRIDHAVSDATQTSQYLAVTVSAGVGNLTMWAVNNAAVRDLSLSSAVNIVNPTVAGAKYSGSMTLLSGTTTGTSSNMTVTMVAPSGTTNTITTNGTVFNFPLALDGPGTHQLGGALTCTYAFGFVHSSLQGTGGTFDTQGYALTCGAFTDTSGIAHNVNLGASTITVTAGDFTVSSAFATVNSGTSTINMSWASAKAFNGNGKTWYNLNQGGVGTMTIAGNNTFNNLSTSVNGSTIKFIGLSQQTFNGTWSINGVAGTLTTIGSTNTSQASIAKASGTLDLSYVSLSYLTGNNLGTAKFNAWTANGCVDGGNNINWRWIQTFDHFLAATPAAVVTAVSTLAQSTPLAGSAAATTTITAPLDLKPLLAASLTAQVTTTGALDQKTPLTSAASAVVSQTAVLAKDVALAASAVGQSNASGILTHGTPLAVVAGTGAVTNIITADLALKTPLASMATNVVTQTSALAKDAPLASNAVATTTITAPLSHGVPLDSSVALSTDITANLGVRVNLAGSAASVVSHTAILLRGKDLASGGGVGAITNIASAYLYQETPLAAAAAATLTINAPLYKGVALAGTEAIQTVVNGQIDLSLNLTATLALSTNIQPIMPTVLKPIGAAVALDVAANAGLFKQSNLAANLTARTTIIPGLRVNKDLETHVLALATVDGNLVFGHFNDIQDIGTSTVEVTVGEIFADVTVVTANSSVSVTTTYASFTASEIYASIPNEGRIYVDAELVELTATATSSDLYLFSKAA